MIPKFVIQHYAYKQHCSLERSEELHLKLELYFKEVMEKSVAIPTQEVDEVWHNFILHTRIYREYCLKYYGKFIHHNPKLPENVDQLILANTPEKISGKLMLAKCDNACNGGAKCDNSCNGGSKCDNQCNGGSWCDSTT